jgi:hypothetical protein
MRKSSVFFIYLAVNLALLLLLSIHALIAVKDSGAGLSVKSDLVKRLGLADLCLFSEARYARHLSLSDFNTPFQDHPMSLEHFPSGSMVGPPDHLKRKAVR